MSTVLIAGNPGSSHLMALHPLKHLNNPLDIYVINVAERPVNRNDYDRHDIPYGQKIGSTTVGTDLRPGALTSIENKFSRLSNSEKWFMIAAITGVLYVWSTGNRFF